VGYSRQLGVDQLGRLVESTRRLTGRHRDRTADRGGPPRPGVAAGVIDVAIDGVRSTLTDCRTSALIEPSFPVFTVTAEWGSSPRDQSAWKVGRTTPAPVGKLVDSA